MNTHDTTPMSPEASSMAGVGFGTLVLAVVIAALVAPILWMLAFGAVAIFPSATGEPAAVEQRLHPDTIPPDAQNQDARHLDAARVPPADLSK